MSGFSLHGHDDALVNRDDGVRDSIVLPSGGLLLASPGDEAMAANLIHGFEWGPGGGVGVNVSYSFPEVTPDYYPGFYEETQGFEQFTTEMQQATRDVFTMLETFTNLTFTETTGQLGDITLGQADLDPAAQAWAYYPDQGSIGGDVWMNTVYAADNQDVTLGGEGFYVLMHEIGHALGLEHTFEVGITGADDSEEFSVMSYDISAWGNRFAQSYMLYDIAALQEIYGANTDYNSGNDIYILGVRNAYTVWDGGGVDTFDARNAIGDATINLTAGEFSSMGSTISDHIAIAYGVTIENARGGSYNDLIAGNAADNILFGLDGNDDLYGYGGNDALIGGNGADNLWGDEGNDRLYGNAGDDIIRGDAGADLLSGGEGNDQLDGGDGIDRLYGNDGDDLIWGYDGADLLVGGLGDDVLLGGLGADRIFAGNGNDSIIGGGDNDRIIADSGNDTARGGDGIDAINGGDGDDTLYGDAGNDRLYGFGDNDTLYGGDNHDVLVGGLGTNHLYGGAGSDRFYTGDGTDIVYDEGGGDRSFDGDGEHTYHFGMDYDRFWDGGGSDTYIAQAINAAVDIIYNFSSTGAEADVLDISNILDLQGGDVLTDYVTFTEVSGDTIISIDQDGSAGVYASQSAVNLDGLTGLNINDMITNGTLIV